MIGRLIELHDRVANSFDPYKVHPFIVFMYLNLGQYFIYRSVFQYFM